MFYFHFKLDNLLSNYLQLRQRTIQASRPWTLDVCYVCTGKGKETEEIVAREEKGKVKKKRRKERKKETKRKESLRCCGVPAVMLLVRVSSHLSHVV